MFDRLLAAVAGLAIAFACAPANAQGAKDTIRVAVYQPVPIIDTIYNPSPETEPGRQHRVRFAGSF